MSQLTSVTISRDESTWEIEIRAEIPPEVLASYREKTLRDIQKSAKLDGFRPGHAPIERIIQIYGEEAIRKQAFEQAIQKELPEILAKENILIIETPRVSIKPSDGVTLARFSAKAPLSPSVELADYKAIAKKHPMGKEPEVTDDEHTEAMTHLRRERARIEKIEAGVEPQKAAEEAREMKGEDLPLLDSTFVQTLGVESAEKFSDSVRTNIKNEKQLRAREKRRAEILDALVQESKISYPALLREYELDDMEARLRADLARMGSNFDTYLAHTKKTTEQIRTEWKEAADKRAKVRLVLSEIARRENIDADRDALTREFEHAKKHVPNADPSALRAHIAHALRNDATLKFLESLT